MVYSAEEVATPMDTAAAPSSPAIGTTRKRLVDDDTMIESSSNDSDSEGTASTMSSTLLPHGDSGYSSDDNDKGKSGFRARSIKRVVKTLMKRHGGSTQHPRVNKILQKLETLNPTEQPAQSDLLLGDFVAHSSPDFPGRVRRCGKNKGRAGEEEVVQYTLGRLSFGIFQPCNLVCTVRAVRNSIEVCDDKELQEECGGRRSYDYPIIMDLTIHAPEGDLQAEIRHEAVCYEMPDNKKRLGVTFLGGSLTPGYQVRSNPELMEQWKKTFTNAYKKADEERSYFGRVLLGMVKWWFKLSSPTDEDAEKSQFHSVRYEMKRRPKGHIDVLYLDEELRVTRGNRGTLIVVERMSYSDTPDSMSQEAITES